MVNAAMDANCDVDSIVACCCYHLASTLGLCTLHPSFTRTKLLRLAVGASRSEDHEQGVCGGSGDVDGVEVEAATCDGAPSDRRCRSSQLSAYGALWRHVVSVGRVLVTMTTLGLDPFTVADEATAIEEARMTSGKEVLHSERMTEVDDALSAAVEFIFCAICPNVTTALSDPLAHLVGRDHKASFDETLSRGIRRGIVRNAMESKIAIATRSTMASIRDATKPLGEDAVQVVLDSPPTSLNVSARLASAVVGGDHEFLRLWRSLRREMVGVRCGPEGFSLCFVPNTDAGLEALERRLQARRRLQDQPAQQDQATKQAEQAEKAHHRGSGNGRVESRFAFREDACRRRRSWMSV